MTSGVPQGSKLGPLCFNIFINDLPSLMKNLTLLYADDGKIIVKINENELLKTLQEDLDKLSQYCEEWSMKLNPDKFE